MFPQDQKYFRFCFGLVLAFVFVPPTSPTHQVSVPKGCIVVASYALKTDWKETNLADAKLLKNSISCIHELYKIWREARNMPQEVRDLVCKASNLGKSTSSIAERTIEFRATLSTLQNPRSVRSDNEIGHRLQDVSQRVRIVAGGTAPSHRVDRQGADAAMGTLGQCNLACDNVKANWKAKTLPSNPQTARSSHLRRHQESSQQ